MDHSLHFPLRRSGKLDRFSGGNQSCAGVTLGRMWMGHFANFWAFCVQNENRTSVNICNYGDTHNDIHIHIYTHTHTYIYGIWWFNCGWTWRNGTSGNRVSSGKVHESARMRHILNLETCIREVDVSQWWLRPFGLRRLPPLMEAKLRCKQVLSGGH